MKFRLGYVAISLTLNDIIHYHTITYTNYQKLDGIAANIKLKEIINKNLSVLETILKYNNLYNIHFYRMNHNMIPLATHPKVVFDYINTFSDKWINLGNYIKDNNLRVDSHPDQYCILNSTKSEIVMNSINILTFNYNIFKVMNINGKTVLHVGSCINGKRDGIERFKTNFKKLPFHLQQMIILENDDKIYNIVDVLEICEELKIPFVLDYHHYICNHEKEKLIDYIPRIFATWNNTELIPKIHFSSPKSRKEKRSHSTYINLKDFLKFLNIFKDFNQDIDIMLECKGKDEALFRLSKQLRMQSNITYIDTSTFKIN